MYYVLRYIPIYNIGTLKMSGETSVGASDNKLLRKKSRLNVDVIIKKKKKK